MERTYQKHEWSRRYTQVLLRLFKTPAPPDFRAHVLRRAQALQHNALEPHGPGGYSRRNWQRYCDWFTETFHITTRHLAVATGLGSACALILGVSLPWWPSLHRGTASPTSVWEMYVEVIPSPEGRAAHAQEYVRSVSTNAAYGPRVVSPVEELVDSTVPQTLPQPAEKREAVSVTSRLERVVTPPLIPPAPWITSKPRPAMQTPPQRARHKRASASKVKSFRKSPAPGKQAPA